MFHSRSSPWCAPRLIHISLPVVVHDQSVSLPAAQSGLQTAPERRMRWTYHHLLQSSEVLLSSGQFGKSASRDTHFFASIAHYFLVHKIVDQLELIDFWSLLVTFPAYYLNTPLASLLGDSPMEVGDSPIKLSLSCLYLCLALKILGLDSNFNPVTNLLGRNVVFRKHPIKVLLSLEQLRWKETRVHHLGTNLMTG